MAIQRSRSWMIVRGIHRWPVNPPRPPNPLNPNPNPHPNPTTTTTTTTNNNNNPQPPTPNPQPPSASNAENVSIRSGAAAGWRTVLKLDLASSYAVLRTGRTESLTSLNYAKLCVELNHTGAAIGEMWGDLAISHFVFEQFVWNRGFPRFRRESVCDRHVDGIGSALKGGYLERQGT